MVTIKSIISTANHGDYTPVISSRISSQKRQFNLGHMLPKSNSKILVVVDSAVETPEILLNGIIPKASVITLNPQQDGIKQITATLQDLNSVSSLHILSHGSPGSLQLGNTHLSLDTLEQYKQQLQNWSVDTLLLYGCNVAAGDAGA